MIALHTSQRQLVRLQFPFLGLLFRSGDIMAGDRQKGMGAIGSPGVERKRHLTWNILGEKLAKFVRHHRSINYVPAVQPSPALQLAERVLTPPSVISCDVECLVLRVRGGDT